MSSKELSFLCINCNKSVIKPSRYIACNCCGHSINTESIYCHSCSKLILCTTCKTKECIYCRLKAKLNK